jgi:hypothetical protein
MPTLTGLAAATLSVAISATFSAAPRLPKSTAITRVIERQ